MNLKRLSALWKTQDDHLSGWEQYRATYELEQQRLPGTMLQYAGWGIVGFVVVMLLWAAFSEVDARVAVRGKLVSTRPPAVIQPIQDGLVRVWNVQAGDVVQKGDILLVLDSTVSAADLQSAQLELWDSQATARRLEAEIKQQEPERFADDEAFHRLAKQLFLSRQAAHQARLDTLDAEQVRLTAQLEQQQQQKQLLAQEVATLKGLDTLKGERLKQEQERYQKQGPRRVDYLQTHADYLRQQRALAQMTSAIQQSEANLADNQVRRNQYLSERQESLATAFHEASRQYAQAVAQLGKYQQARTIVELKAPFASVVIKSTERPEGSVVQKGETLLQLAAIDQPLRAEVQISPEDIALVDTSQSVLIKLDSLPFTRFGTLDGTLSWVSPDVVTLNDSQNRFGYTAHIAVSGELRSTPPAFRLLPGMTLEADIATGSRTILSYLAYPVHRALAEGFREP
ncbi:HlyD family type I secretion periplasmic adaptor subunit [Parendozoicomonas haliclonae]|uniref:Membrane fusion protein (MFP) family protein n=1 Tax=Parendozoicomonas haliclonae TaxID=1960125 RepID=A0A1X7AEZ5_9GAMM|nr:HlyD family type I secretion periplasmic adaptor subunit [Parendozoicomonas haliclonae]SMA35604.1 Hemolysin secretion protein D, plasmid [Parendozoicomonas haliclonae]